MMGMCSKKPKIKFIYRFHFINICMRIYLKKNLFKNDNKAEMNIDINWKHFKVIMKVCLSFQ